MAELSGCKPDQAGLGVERERCLLIPALAGITQGGAWSQQCGRTARAPGETVEPGARRSLSWHAYPGLCSCMSREVVGENCVIESDDAACNFSAGELQSYIAP
jgi:hypothetical protein